MTSLSLQLKRLALPQSDPSLFSRKNVASLLFEPQEAATLDRSTVHALGCTGLEELSGIDPSLGEFRRTLFSAASVTLERSVQTKDTNAKLDRDIGRFLCRASPYFLLKPTHKCLEWLIHRFHIHLYNVDSLVSCVLPFHDSRVFVRVVQLLQIQDPSSRWHWLHRLQNPGVPLSRLTLVTHCHRDLSFMDFICDMVSTSIQAFSDCPGAGASQLRVIFSFFASTIVSALDSAETITDAIITKLLPHVQKGLRSALQDFRASALMILCQLSVKVVMESVLVRSLASALCKSLRDQVLVREGLGALIVLLQNQDHAEPTHKSLSRLRSVSDLVSSLESMCQTHDVSPLLRHLLPHLLNCTFSSGDSGEAGSSAELLQNLLTCVPLSSDLQLRLCSLLLDLYLSQSGRSEEDLGELNQRVVPVLRLLEAKYNSSLDRSLSSRVSDLSDVQKPLFHQLLSLSNTSGKFQLVGDSHSSLLLSLNHPQASIRVMALDKLKDMISPGEVLSVDQDFLTSSVFERLRDDEAPVVSAALQVLQVLQERLDSQEVVSCLVSLLFRVQVFESQLWGPVLSEAVRLLPAVPAVPADERLLFRLLPLAVPSGPRDSLHFKLSLSLAQSPVLQQHPLTTGWSADLDEALGSGPDQVLVLVQTLVSTLSRNLQNMDPFSRRHTMDALCSRVELLSESGSGPDRTPLLVLVQTLVLGLKNLTDTQHLLTARRLLSLMQRLLQENRPEGSQEPVSVPGLGPASLFSDWLDLYLQTGDGQVEFSLVLVSVLSRFIQELRSPDQSFKEELWWNPERLDTNTCCYLQLLAQVFSVLMGGASDGPITVQYRPLLKLLLQVHLDSPLLVFRFLSLVWSWGGLHGDQGEGRGQARPGAVLQLHALLMGAALLENQSTAQLQEVVLKTPVLASVLVVLSSPLREVRRAGLVVLRSLSAVGASLYRPITERLLRTGEELEADCDYLSRALGALYSAHTQEVGASDSAHTQEVGVAFRTLLQSVQSERCPSSTACSLLRALSHVHGQEVLSTLLPALDRLLAPISPDAPSRLPDESRLLALLLGKFSPAAAPLLVTDAHCTELFLRALKTKPDRGQDRGQDRGPSVQVSALEQVSPGFFSALSEEVQQLVLSAMFDVLEEEPSATTAHTVCSVFKRLSLDAALVASELCPEKPSAPVSVQQTRRSKILSKRAGCSVALSSVGGAVSWSRVTLILELLQHKKKLNRPQILIPTICSLLQRRLEASLEDQASVEYTKQLLLGALLSMCRKLSPNGAPIPPDVLDPQRLSVELVVQCIRSSEMSQTHHQALLLLSALAPLYPEKVLLNIMPIFTFMGANILRLDDAYSFRVIDKTVQMVIPAIIQAQDSGLDSPQVRAVVTRIVQVFVQALPHVPDHRRVPVLLQLLNTIGPERYLWALLCLLCEQQSTAHPPASTSAEEKDSALQQEWDLWVSVFCEFEVKVQIQALVQVLVFLQQLPHDKDEAADPRASCRRAALKPQEQQNRENLENMEDLIFSLEQHSSKELRHFKYLSVTFSSHLLASERFIHKVLELEQDGGDESLQEQQQRLLEQILCFLHSVARCSELNSDKPTAKFWRVLLNKSYDLLDKVHALLPSDSFIAVTRGLMGNEVSNVRRKALELLNHKLQQKISWSPQQVSLLLSLTPDLLACVSSSDPSVNRQTALFSLKLLCRLFGSSEPRSFVAVMQVAAGVVTATEEEDRNVMATALQCVAECVTATKALAIPHLPSLIPAVLTCLSDRKDCLSSELFLLSAVTALHRITETLHNFTSPYLHDITAQVCRLSRLAEVSAPSPLLAVRLASLRSTIATKVPPRVLLPTVTKCYARLVQDQKNQLVALMSILQEHISHMDRDQLSLHQSELTTFFLTALDFRAAHCQEDLQEAQKVEGAVIDCFVALVLKFSEVTFRPLFFKLLEWSRGAPCGQSRGAPCGQSERLLTLVRLCDSVALRLKGLFVLFSGNLLPLFCDLLSPRSAQAPLFQSEEKSCLLVSLVLDCLQKICLYDTNKFLNHERTEALMRPLVDQLENLQGGPGEFRRRVAQNLVPCLGQFSVALADDAQWKKLNYEVLLKTRSPEPQVRLSALFVLLEFCSRLRENYLLLLPETVPFLAELMEDDSEEVEKEVQRVVQEMENVLGEPLQSYF